MHIPVLLDEVLEALAWKEPGASVLDLTFGGGGHLRALLERNPPAARIVAVDQDPDAISRAESLRASYPIEVFHMNYSEFLETNTDLFDRILLDCGVSSFQLDQADRGFSFRQDGPLDMRMNPSEGVPAWEWLESCSEKDFADVVYHYGEERRSRVWARKWVHARKSQQVRTTKDFVEALGLKLESRDKRGHHPLTRVFQGIRIHINDEMRHLRLALEHLPRQLKKSGRLAIISFHSLEDREVKWALRGKLKPVNKKVIVASDKETEENPRARSAKLRVYQMNEDLEESRF